MCYKRVDCTPCIAALEAVQLIQRLFWPNCRLCKRCPATAATQFTNYLIDFGAEVN